MSKRIALAAAALMLAVGAGGIASAATVKKTPVVAHPRNQASLQCSAEANAKGLHGKARVHFRRECLRKAMHNASYQKSVVKHVQPANTHKKVDKLDKQT